MFAIQERRLLNVTRKAIVTALAGSVFKNGSAGETVNMAAAIT